MFEEGLHTVAQSSTGVGPASPGRVPYEWCVRGRWESPPGSDAEITLDLIRDLTVDRKQTGLIKLRLSNVQSRFLAVVVTERQFQQFPAPHSRGEQEDYRKPSQFRAKRRCRIPFQARSRSEQFPHFGRGEYVWLEPLMVGRKETGVRNEALRFGPAAIQAEAPNLQHAHSSNPRSNVFVSVTPRLKRGGIQVRVLCALVAEEPIQGLQRAGWKIETPPQSSLQIHIPGEGRRQARRKHRGKRRGSFHH